MKTIALLGALALLLLPGCVTDDRGRTTIDPVKAGQWIDTGSRLLETIERFNGPRADIGKPISTDTIRTEGGEYRRTGGSEWRYVPAAAPTFRTSEIPASWQRTLYHQGQTIEPLVVLNGNVIE